jgi:hypothetical protein
MITSLVMHLCAVPYQHGLTCNLIDHFTGIFSSGRVSIIHILPEVVESGSDELPDFTEAMSHQTKHTVIISKLRMIKFWRRIVPSLDIHEIATNPYYTLNIL